MMKAKTPTWASAVLLPVAIAVAGAVASAIASRLTERYMNKEAALWVWRAAGVELWPMWFGLALMVLFLFARSLYRLYRLNNARWVQFRDETTADFDLWLKDRKQDFTDRYEQNFRNLEAEAVNKAAFDRNLAERLIARFEGWMGTVDRRLDAIESRLTRLEEKP